MADVFTACPTQDSGRVLVGTSSWSDSSLTQDGNWYPRKTMKAVDRIAFYSEHFPLVEMETTYRFPPTVAVTEQWVDRTPEGFTFDLPAWSLLTGQPTFPPSLYEDLMPEVRTDRRDRPRLYASHLSTEALDECWNRFIHSLRPLEEADKLGTIILKFPRWLKPGSSSGRMLEDARNRLGNRRLAVEIANPAWVDAESCESTFALLEDLDMSFVCIDAAEDHPRSLGKAEATTSGLAIIRLLGRRQREEGDEWRDDWRSYRYEDHELDDIMPRIKHLAEGCDELHVLFSTCWRDDAVRNGEALQQRLGLHPRPQLAG